MNYDEVRIKEFLSWYGSILTVHKGNTTITAFLQTEPYHTHTRFFKTRFACKPNMFIQQQMIWLHMRLATQNEQAPKSSKTSSPMFSSMSKEPSRFGACAKSLWALWARSCISKLHMLLKKTCQPWGMAGKKRTGYLSTAGHYYQLLILADASVSKV